MNSPKWISQDFSEQVSRKQFLSPSAHNPSLLFKYPIIFIFFNAQRTYLPLAGSKIVFNLSWFGIEQNTRIGHIASPVRTKDRIQIHGTHKFGHPDQQAGKLYH